VHPLTAGEKIYRTVGGRTVCKNAGAAGRWWWQAERWQRKRPNENPVTRNAQVAEREKTQNGGGRTQNGRTQVEQQRQAGRKNGGERRGENSRQNERHAAGRRW